MNKLAMLDHICQNNSFSKIVRHSSSVEMDELVDRMSFYLFRKEYRETIKSANIINLYDNKELHVKFADKMFERVPEFQRENNKWNSKMQESYVFNILKGYCSNPIILYTLDENVTDCFILDGLQRLTALYRFLIKQDMTFDLGNGTTINSKEVTDAGRSFIGMRRIAFDVKIYQFKNELQAVNHYIEINEGITHSPEDILKAKVYRDSLIKSGMKA